MTNKVNVSALLKGSLSEVPYVEIILHNGTSFPVESHGIRGREMCNPFVVVEIGKEQLKSDVYKNTQNPDFKDEKFLFGVKVDEPLLLNFHVYDWHLVNKDAYIGSCSIQLDQMSRDVPVRKKLNLTSSSVDASIEVTIIAHNFGVNGSESILIERDSIVANPLDVVFEKLRKSVYGVQFDSDEKLMQYAEFLSSVSKLKETYLNTKWANSIELKEQLSQSEDPEDQDELERIKKLNVKAADNMLKHRVAVKVVIIDQEYKSKSKQAFRKAVSPILSSLDLVPNLGFFHSALIVGPWLLEWNNSALCVPRKCLSSASLLSADVDAIDNVTDLDKVVNELAKGIVDWNTRMKYSAIGGDLMRGGNCQEFIENLCTRIGVSLPKSGPLAKWLKRLRK